LYTKLGFIYKKFALFWVITQRRTAQNSGVLNSLLLLFPPLIFIKIHAVDSDIKQVDATSPFRSHLHILLKKPVNFFAFTTESSSSSSSSALQPWVGLGLLEVS
jgi:hypothetical protein